MVALPVRRLTCPKCGGSFDYEYVPGASLTAVRLGGSRYMRCPLCHQWSVFRLSAAEVPARPGLDEPSASAATPIVSGSGVRRFSDVPSALGGAIVLGGLVVAIVLSALLLPRPEPAIAAIVVGLIAIVGLAYLWFARGRLRETPPSPR